MGPRDAIISASIRFQFPFVRNFSRSKFQSVRVQESDSSLGLQDKTMPNS